MYPTTFNPVFNMTLASEGPVTVPFNVDFATELTQEIDITQLVNARTISYISGVYADNSTNSQDVSLACNSTNQIVIIPANSQGWYPLLIPNPPIFTVSQGAAGDICKLHFVNFPVWPFIYDPNVGGGAISGPTVSDYTFDMAGGNETVFAAGEAARYLFILNPTGNADVVLNLAGGDASVSGITLIAGASFELAAGVANAVTVAGGAAETLIAFGGA